jgi:hypothetical protein
VFTRDKAGKSEYNFPLTSLFISIYDRGCDNAEARKRGMASVEDPEFSPAEALLRIFRRFVARAIWASQPRAFATASPSLWDRLHILRYQMEPRSRSRNRVRGDHEAQFRRRGEQPTAGFLDADLWLVFWLLFS